MAQQDSKPPATGKIPGFGEWVASQPQAQAVEQPVKQPDGRPVPVPEGTHRPIAPGRYPNVRPDTPVWDKDAQSLANDPRALKPSDRLPDPIQIDQQITAQARTDAERLTRPIPPAGNRYPRGTDNGPFWTPPEDKPAFAPHRPGLLEQATAPVRNSAIGRAFGISSETPESREEHGQNLMNFEEALPSGTGHGAVRGTVQFASGLTSPENLMIMAATSGLGALEGALGKTAISKLVSLGFSAQMLRDAATMTPKFMEAVKAGDWPRAREIAARAVLATGMAAMAAHHGGSAEKAGPTFTPTMLRDAMEPEEAPSFAEFVKEQEQNAAQPNTHPGASPAPQAGFGSGCARNRS